MPACSTSWKHEPFKEGIPIPYQAAFDNQQFARLKEGFIPQEMEDKWFIYYEEPYLFLHRSWGNGQPVFRVSLRSTDKGAEVSEALWSKNLASDSKWGTNYWAALLDFLVSNLLLGLRKPFPLPPGPITWTPGALQHSFSGTGYQESPATPTKPWWRIW
jgi:hypothetical protein